MSVLLLIIGLVLFIGLVVIHEFGHFIMARRNGVEVEEFGIGFPPAFWTKRIKSPKGDYDFTLNALPLGGFVRLKGENDADKRPGSFGAAPLKGKVQIMVAGVVMNLLAAFALLTFLALTGMPTLIKNNQFALKNDVKIIREVEHKNEVGIVGVEKGSPAETIGIKEGDILLKINDTDITDPEMVSDIAKSRSGQNTEVTYKQGDQTLTKSVVFSDNKDQKGYLGVIPASNETGIQVRRFTWSAPIVAAGFMKQVTILTFEGLGDAIANISRGNVAKASEQVSGPVGIFVILKNGSVLGYQFILMIIAIISLTLAIMNALPIPALDGGRLFVTLLFRAMNKPLTQRTEELIHGTGLIALLILFVLITIVDVKRFF